MRVGEEQLCGRNGRRRGAGCTLRAPLPSAARTGAPEAGPPAPGDGVNEVTRFAMLARSGDRVALAAFIRGTQPDVWRLCSHLGGPAEADDLTQETYLRALPALARFRGDSNARTWLLCIARRTVADHIRSAQRRRRLHGSLPTPTDTHDAAQDSEVDLMLGGLEPDRRTAFVLTQMLGLSYAEAADVCGVPVGTIRSRVARARTHLVEALRTEVAE